MKRKKFFILFLANLAQATLRITGGFTPIKQYDQGRRIRMEKLPDGAGYKIHELNKFYAENDTAWIGTDMPYRPNQ